jgi:hypothetical protein
MRREPEQNSGIIAEESFLSMSNSVAGDGSRGKGEAVDPPSPASPVVTRAGRNKLLWTVRAGCASVSRVLLFA